MMSATIGVRPHMNTHLFLFFHSFIESLSYAYTHPHHLTFLSQSHMHLEHRMLGAVSILTHQQC